MGKNISDEVKKDICHRKFTRHHTLESIAKHHNLARQTVAKIIKEHKATYANKTKIAQFIENETKDLTNNTSDGRVIKSVLTKVAITAEQRQVEVLNEIDVVYNEAKAVLDPAINKAVAKYHESLEQLQLDNPRALEVITKGIENITNAVNNKLKATLDYAALHGIQAPKAAPVTIDQRQVNITGNGKVHDTGSCIVRTKFVFPSMSEQEKQDSIATDDINQIEAVEVYY